MVHMVTVYCFGSRSKKDVAAVAMMREWADVLRGSRLQRLDEVKYHEDDGGGQE